MTYHRHALLGGIAALALVAGSGLASAQQSSTEHGAAGQAPHATQQMNKSPEAGSNMGQSSHGMSQQRTEQNAGKSNKSATEQTQQKGSAAAQRDESKPGKTAQENKAGKNTDRLSQGAEKERFGKSAQDRDRNATEKRNQGTAAQQNRTGQQNNTAQRKRNGMEGLQGNATGMNAPLNDQQRTQIRDTVIHASGAPRVGHVDFDVAVGTTIPRGRIHVVPVPETLVRIDPAWRGFLYFVYEDEVVIVNPHNMRIVAVVPA